MRCKTESPAALNFLFVFTFFFLDALDQVMQVGFICFDILWKPLACEFQGCIGQFILAMYILFQRVTSSRDFRQRISTGNAF